MTKNSSQSEIGHKYNRFLHCNYRLFAFGVPQFGAGNLQVGRGQAVMIWKIHQVGYEKNSCAREVNFTSVVVQKPSNGRLPGFARMKPTFYVCASVQHLENANVVPVRRPCLEGKTLSTKPRFGGKTVYMRNVVHKTQIGSKLYGRKRMPDENCQLGFGDPKPVRDVVPPWRPKV